MRVFLFLFGILLPQLVWAQSPVETSEDPSTEEEAPFVPSFLGGQYGKGFLVAPTTRATGFGSQPGITVGGRAGWLFHHRLVLGAEAHVLASPTVWHADNQQVLSMAYGGFFAEGFLGGKRAVQGVIHAFWGFGEAHFRSSLDLAEISEVTGIMVVELQAAVSFAPFSWMRLQMGPGFRFAPGAELHGLSGTDFWAPYGEFSVAFGLF